MLDVGHRVPREIAGPLGEDRGHGALKVVLRKPTSFSGLSRRVPGSRICWGSCGMGTWRLPGRRGFGCKEVQD